MEGDDVFTTQNIVDCDVLEASKENVRPLASGRRVTALSSILATPHAHREEKLSATRNRLRINIELALEDEDGDPLEAYCTLVNWTVENYPQGPSVESGLIELLEEATRVLKDDRGGQWRGDMKYLKLWLQYASFVEKPTLIYRFLIANEIGTQHALLYEEYAAVLERDSRRKEADETYSLGIARKAAPLDHLKSRHEDFQKRMMSSLLSAAAAPAPAPATTSRPALATTAKPSASASRIAAPRGVSSSSSTTTHSANNGRMQIFVDPTGSESTAGELATNTWTDIGTRKGRIKENVPETKKLAGTTLKQPGRSKRIASGSSSSGASGSKIAVFRDPGPEEMPPPPVPAARSSQQPSLPPKTPAKSSISVFVDGQGDEAQQANPSTPMFTPFRDEDSSGSTPGPSAHPMPDLVMKVKSTGAKVLGLTSEAEALRKDPLKNHGQALNEGDG